MDAPALVSSPTLSVTAQGEIFDAPKVDDAPKPNSGLHALKAERAGRISIEKMDLRPSLVGRMLRASIRFLFAVLIGVCGTLGWQRYGDQATEIAKSQITAHAPSLAEFITPGKSEPPRLDAAERQPQPASPASDVPQEARQQLDATDVTELRQQLKDIAADLAAAKKTIEQLSAAQGQLIQSQQQMTQRIAKLHAPEQGVSQKPSSTTTAVRAPTPKPRPF